MIFENVLKLCLCSPGSIDTPMLDNLIGDPSKVDGMKEWIAGLCPMKRQGQSEEIAEAFAFMASDNASFITGQTLIVDGGYTLGSVDMSH